MPITTPLSFIVGYGFTLYAINENFSWADYLVNPILGELSIAISSLMIIILIGYLID
ncbi:hypothetical protein [Acaryochloris sp. CCMEE 5410]|uniref:hypothetical protein n=1 Tax=Acaryochloris sp. CCMEE 5410 TaxID=310037 RepID=UPI00158517DC|nr:hypothetical protein [Acaryochloris sp. CCMEE 5410]